MFTTFREIIAAWKSIAQFADDIQTSENTAKGMRWRNSIPSDYWALVIAGADRRGINGVTFEALAELAAQKSRKHRTRKLPTRRAPTSQKTERTAA